MWREREPREKFVQSEGKATDAGGSMPCMDLEDWSFLGVCVCVSERGRVNDNHDGISE